MILKFSMRRKHTIKGHVKVYEMLGEDAIIHVRIEGSKTNLVVKSISKELFEVGDSLYLGLPEKFLYLFDKATELALVN